jgi:hypothetical protein
MDASYRGFETIAQSLIRAGADVNAKNAVGTASPIVQ